jgi:hypothetical protein
MEVEFSNLVNENCKLNQKVLKDKQYLTKCI